MSRYKQYSILFLLLQLFFSVKDMYAASRRPDYAQYGSEAFFNSLGVAGAMIPGDISNIYYLPSNLAVHKSEYSLNYGYEGRGANNVSLDYATRGLLGLPNLTLGVGGLFTFLQQGKNHPGNYFDGKLTSKFPFQGNFAVAAAYNLGEYGRIGGNVKLPFNNYFAEKDFDMGLLLGVSYSIDWLGFTLSIGISNLGFMVRDTEFRGMYPDLNLGVAYNYFADNGERVVSLAFALENNLGEFIKDSNVLGLALSTRIFSTEVVNSDLLIEDAGLDAQDDLDKILKKDDFYANLYFNLGFQFSDDTHFAMGFSSKIYSYSVDIALIFPSQKNNTFSFYVSLANPF